MTAPISNGPTTHGYTTMRDATRPTNNPTYRLSVSVFVFVNASGSLEAESAGSAAASRVLGDAVFREPNAWMISRRTHAHKAATACEGSHPVTANQAHPPSNTTTSNSQNSHRTAPSKAMAPVITAAFHATG